jgi:hypothetical protein
MQVISVNQVITAVAMRIKLVKAAFTKASVIVRTIGIDIINQIIAAFASGAFIVGTTVTNWFVIHRRIVIIRDDFTTAGT